MSSAVDLDALVKGAGGEALEATDMPGVYRLAERLLPRHSRRVQAQKAAILHALGSVLPHMAICLDAHDMDLLEELGAVASAVTAPVPQWVPLQPSDLEKVLPVLYRGAWGLFFSGTQSLSSQGPDRLSFSPHEVRALTSRMHAVASVTSWYDDVEWIICLLSGAQEASK